MNRTVSTRSATIGRQTFDGLGRQLCVEVGGRITEYHYLPGQMPPCANTLADGQRIDFSYVAELNNLVTQIRPAGEAAHLFDYDPLLGMIRSCKGPLGEQVMTYTAGAMPKRDTWSLDGSEHVTTWRHSLSGRLLGYTDAADVEHQRGFDVHGRLCRVQTGEIRCDIDYDPFSRPSTYTTVDTASGRRLVQTLSYDSLGREQSRCFVATFEGASHTQLQILTYTALDQVESRTWQGDGHCGTETFGYDLLGRLHTYTADPAIAPIDPFGNRVVAQRFSFNALDGYEHVLSHFVDGSSDVAAYGCDNPEDPCQVTSIRHTHASWPALIDLEYDACGRLIHDSLGRSLYWDAQNRLTRVDYQGQTCRYGYDPSGNLCDRTVAGQLARSFFSAGQMTHEQRAGQTWRPVSDAGQLLAVQRLTDGVRQGNAALLGCDAQGSVRVEVDAQVRSRRYTPYGAEQAAAVAEDMPFGFAGERREPLTGWYIPAGYRPYDPLLMLFLAPDSLSPFGRGGLNPYAYCAGDPVNRIDPDGHSWKTWLIAGIGLALGAVATVATFGAAAPAFAAVYAGGLSALTASGAVAMGAATLGAVSLGTGVASVALEAVDKDSKAASILGWISLGTGLLGSGLELAPKAASASMRLARSAGKGLRNSRHANAVQLSGRATAGSSRAVPLSARPPQSVIGFYGNYDGLKGGAFITHGDKYGYLMDLRGKMGPPEIIAQELIAPSLEQFAAVGKVDLNRPLVLLACNAADSGAAQRVSNYLGMKVTAPLGEVRVPKFYDLQKNMHTRQGMGTGTVLSKRSTLPGNLGASLSKEEYVPVLWRMFSPVRTAQP